MPEIWPALVVKPRNFCAAYACARVDEGRIPCFGKDSSTTTMAAPVTRALMIGVGGVGEAIARMLLERDWMELVVLAGEL